MSLLSGFKDYTSEEIITAEPQKIEKSSEKFINNIKKENYIGQITQKWRIKESLLREKYMNYYYEYFRLTKKISTNKLIDTQVEKILTHFKIVILKNDVLKTRYVTF